MCKNGSVSYKNRNSLEGWAPRADTQPPASGQRGCYPQPGVLETVCAVEYTSLLQGDKARLVLIRGNKTRSEERSSELLKQEMGTNFPSATPAWAPLTFPGDALSPARPPARGLRLAAGPRWPGVAGAAGRRHLAAGR